MSAQLAVEEGGSMAQYHRIHAAGCRDLRDANPVGSASDWEGVYQAVTGMYGDEYDDVAHVRRLSAPCVAKALRTNQGE